MDAKTLYRQGVLAIRDEKDPVRGRELLLQSLKLEPNNDMAWLWLVRTTQDRQQQMACVERALRLNPANEHALQLKARWSATDAPAAAPVNPVPASDTALVAGPAVEPPRRAIRPLKPKEKRPSGPTPDQVAQIGRHMDRAEAYMEAGDSEAAVAEWVAVLKIQVDHADALRNAAGHLWKMHYRDDAKELVWRAINANTAVPSIYMTGIDMAERENNYLEADQLRQRIATLPSAEEGLLMEVADYYARRHQLAQAIEFMERAVESHPTSQKLLYKMGDLYQEIQQPQKAMACYDQAVRLAPRSKTGREADKKLGGFVPVLTDRERGNVWLAVRETAGFTIFYLLIGWQDAGLNLLHMGPLHWLGILLGTAGGYVFITATSSPQQQPVASWLGGTVPPEEPALPELHPASLEVARTAPGQALQDPTHLPIIAPDLRWLLGVIGAIILIAAFALAFSQSINQVFDNPPPYLPWSAESYR